MLKLLALIGIVAGVLWAPIPLASSRPRFWFPLESYVFLLFTLYAVARLIDHRRGGDKLSSDQRFITWACIFWLGYQIVQILPLPSWFIDTLSPNSYRVSISFENTYYTTLSIDKYATLEEFFKRLMYVIALVLLVKLVTTRKYVKVIAIALIFAGVLQSIYGFLIFSITDIKFLTGTFTNRNHFALYIAVCLSLLMGFYRYSIYKNQGPIISAQNIVIFGAVLVFVAALSFALSKGAVLSFALALFICTFLVKGIAKDRAGKRIFFSIAAAVVVSVSWFGASGILQRFSYSLIRNDERILQWGDSLRLFYDYWLTGSGSGTYKYAFASYKSELYRPLFYNHAHNDYIELMCNEGVIGLVLFLSVILAGLARIVKGTNTRRDPLVKGIGFGTVLALLTILIHGMFDYNLQIPANALLFFAVMGLGLATVKLESKRTKRTEICRT